MVNITRRQLLIGGAGAALAGPGIVGLMTSEDHVEVDGIRTDSLWTTEIDGLPVQPRFSGDCKVDVAVIGGGYTGLSTAYYVKKFRPDWTVVVLESHEIGSGASSRNSGAVYAHYVGIDNKEMPKRGLERLRTFIDKQEIDCDFSPASTLTVYSSKSDANAAQQTLPAGAEWINAEELKARAGTSFYAGAVDAPDYFKVQPAKLLVGTAKAALDVGVQLFEHSPVLKIESGKSTHLTTSDGKIIANKVMIATNAYTPRLGLMKYQMFPLHQYSFATRQLTEKEISALGLNLWDLRFEPRTLPITFSLTPSRRFFIRIVLGYASHDATEWADTETAKRKAHQIFLNRYPQLADIGLDFDWHGVTGHTSLMKPIAGVLNKEGNIHISVAYNGLGVMPSHNNGYLTACRMTGRDDQDLHFLSGVSNQLFVPGDYYRSLLLKPFMHLMAPS